MPQWLLQLSLPDSYGGAGQGRLANTACRTGGGQWITGTGCSCDWAASRWTAWLGPGPPLALAAHTTGRLAAVLDKMESGEVSLHLVYWTMLLYI